MSNTALVLIDMQNDFLHPEGAYARAGISCEAISALSALLAPVCDAIRRSGGWVVSTHAEPFISEHLQELRPFLAKGDFSPGSFGHALIEELSPADLSVEKVAYSAFYMSRLEWVLHQAGITHLVAGGIVTNGGVASTVRDAHVHGFEVTVLSDGCAAFDQQVHDVNLEALGSIARLISCAELIDQLSG